MIEASAVKGGNLTTGTRGCDTYEMSNALRSVLDTPLLLLALDKSKCISTGPGTREVDMRTQSGLGAAGLEPHDFGGSRPKSSRCEFRLRMRLDNANTKF